MKINHIKSTGAQKTTNYEGGVAYTPSAKTELIQRVITCYWGEPKFYEKGDVTGNAIIQLIQKVAKEDPLFVLQLAKTIRNPPYNMRTVAVVMWVEAGLNEDIRSLRDEEGRSLVARFAPSIIRRADELTDALAYLIGEVGQIGTGGQGSIPAGIKKGLALAFDNFDEYNFAKYRASDKAVKLKDVLKLVRPKPHAITLNGKEYTKKQRSELYKHIVDDVLRQDDTWESILSAEGRSMETWNKIIGMGNKVGLMALTRNLRNMLQVGANVNPVLKRLTDEKQVLASKQHSYRYYTAWKMLQHEGLSNAQKTLEALETAIELSAGNLPKLGGKTAIIIDSSASMEQQLSAESVVQYSDCANFLGAVSHYISDESIVIAYSEHAKVVPLSRNDSIINNMEKIDKAMYGSSTNTHLAIRELTRLGFKADRIINFTDMQPQHGIEDEVQLFRKKINPNCWFYDINMAGYGNVELNPHNKLNVNLAGWSAQILNFIQANEQNLATFAQTVSTVRP